MNVFEIKSTENKDSFIELEKKEYYNASASRAYYSAYQFILMQIDKNGQKIVTDFDRTTNKGPHELNLELFQECLLDRGVAEEEVENINSYIKELKRFRIKADYKAEKITKKDIEKIKNKLECITKKGRV